MMLFYPEKPLYVALIDVLVKKSYQQQKHSVHRSKTWSKLIISEEEIVRHLLDEATITTCLCLFALLGDILSYLVENYIEQLVFF